MSDSMDDFDYTEVDSTEGLDDKESLPDYDHDHDSLESPGDQTQGNPDDVVIAVMGATGSGKSSFIRLLTGDSSVAVGNSLESETSDIQVVRYIDSNSGRNVTIVDTPGFDDSRESITDTEVLKRVTKFLLDVYDKDRKLNGLIYVQRISDPRFGGQSARNLRMFRNLCGEGGYKNVVVLTTFWDKVTNKEEGRMRETQLQTKFFKELVEGGARFMKHDRSPRSVQDVLKHVFTLVPTHVKIQEEIRVEGKSLEDTAAGSVHRKEVEQLIAKHRKDVAELKAEMNEAKKTNAALAKELKGEREQLQLKLREWEKERVELRNGLDEGKKAVERMKVDAEEEKKNHAQWRNDKEREWKGHLDSQANTHDQALQKMQAQIEQQKKSAESAKEQEAERRANTAERERLVAERALQAERNKSWMKKGSEAADAIPIVGALLKPGLAIGGAVLDVVSKANPNSK